MTPQEALERLDDMADGRPQFKEIADVIREARELINRIGTTGVNRTDIIARADKWLGLKPLRSQSDENPFPSP